MGISFGRIAFYNTVWLNVAWALAAIASVVSEVINDPKWQGLENIAAIILVILVIPAFLDWALNRRGNRWAIRLVKDDIPIKYLAGAAVPFIFGFFWRYCLIFVILIYPVNLNVVAVYGTKLAPVVNIIIGFVGSNLAFYWLYKYPLGSLKIQQYDRSLLPELSIGTLTSVEVEGDWCRSFAYSFIPLRMR
ncbi:MAG: hypothetical protein HYX63_03240 [Gammaproteobacteria bacterium]|nr:hypothetical protein [Gammaproteobacteria bacterium]